MTFYHLDDLDENLDLLGADDIGCMMGGVASDAIATGNRDENALTDLEFHARHPERGGKRIEAGEKALAKEWLSLRDDVVRPALRAADAAARAAGVAPPAPPPPAAAAPLPPGVVVAAQEDRTKVLVAGGLGLVALLGIIVAAVKK